MDHLQNIINDNRRGKPTGIYSVCSAHPLVIEAAIENAQNEKTPLLIEATANQVNQFGGYTGMRAADFYQFVKNLADKKKFSMNDIILGGDHLGPVCWSKEKSDDAMNKADTLIREYVATGFKKIHLDCSMECADDLPPLNDETIASRAARLCKVAETEAIKTYGSSDIIYIIGTEVPPPGGTNEKIQDIDVTKPSHALRTLDVHKKAFHENKLHDAWQRVVGIVVQPGVEFSHTSVVHYDRKKAKNLGSVISSCENIVFEAHSTDYQKPENYKYLVEDHFAILKVGPQLTFALREALYALENIEAHLVEKNKCSRLYETCEDVMLSEPKYWKTFYEGSDEDLKFLRHFSYSDRIRYYWSNPKVLNSVNSLLKNLSSAPIPLTLVSQYLPEQHTQILNDSLINKPEELIKAKIKSVLSDYSSACFRKL